MTAVEFLIREIEALGDAGYSPEEAVKIYGEKAKQLEKEQIIIAWSNGFDDSENYIENGELYYNNKFKNK